MKTYEILLDAEKYLLIEADAVLDFPDIFPVLKFVVQNKNLSGSLDVVAEYNFNNIFGYRIKEIKRKNEDDIFWGNIPETFPFIQIWKSGKDWNVLIVTKTAFDADKNPDSFFAWKSTTRTEALAFIQGLQYSMAYRMMEIREGRYKKGS